MVKSLQYHYLAPFSSPSKFLTDETKVNEAKFIHNIPEGFHLYFPSLGTAEFLMTSKDLVEVPCTNLRELVLTLCLFQH